MRMSNQVKASVGKWDIYRVVHKDYNRDAAVRKMIELIGVPYGWRALLKTGLLHLPLGRKLWPRTIEEDTYTGFPHCAMATSRAARAGGVDLYPSRSDLFTEPGHLALSLDTRYRFTLV